MSATLRWEGRAPSSEIAGGGAALEAMRQMTCRTFFPIQRLFLGALFALAASASAGEWPEGYAVHHGTESPDGHYGIAVTTEESHTEAINYLADLKTHQVLGKIACGDYFEGENHRDLRAVWADDSTWCVAVYTERFSFGSIALLERKDSGLMETDIDERISKSLQSAAGDEGYDDVHFRCTADRKLLTRAIFYTGNPKMNDAKTRYARFEGTFDLDSRKWTKAESHRMNLPKPVGDGEVYSAVYLALMTAYSDYSPVDLDLAPTSSDKEKADRLDEIMNQVYQGVRAVLPPERFANVKKEQIAWLKTRDAVPSVSEKCKLLEARIKALQNLLW